ncbi:MAG: pyridoxamine 5'-phosphate oxidase family protein [Actinomycetota bacterium]
MPKLDDAELAAFLDEPGHLVRIGTVDGDGMPRVTPTWFVHHAGAILFTPRSESVFLANLRRDDRVALLVDETALPYRKVNVAGRAELLHDLGDDDAWRDRYREIAMRYIEPDAAEAYIQATIDQPRALLGVTLAGASVTSWRMPVGDEDGTGIWARRYYAEGTKMARRADEA